MNFVLAFCLLVSVSLCPAQVLDHCKIVVTSDLNAADNQQVVAVVPLQVCIYGEIEWYHPKGTLLFTNLIPAKSFELCVEADWATSLSGVAEMTYGQHTPLPVPIPGKPSCTLASRGSASLLLSAPPPVNGQYLYMSSINYLVLDPSMVHGSLTPHP